MRRTASVVALSALLAGAAAARPMPAVSAATWYDSIEALTHRGRAQPGVDPFKAGWPEAVAVSAPIGAALDRLPAADKRCAPAKLNIEMNLLASDLKAMAPADRAATGMDAAVARFVRQHFPCPAAPGVAPSVARILADLEAAGREAQATPHLAGPFPPEAGNGPAATLARGDLMSLSAGYRAELAADQRAGRRSGVCLPPPGQASLNSAGLETALRAIPPTDRDTSAAPAFRLFSDAHFACAPASS